MPADDKNRERSPANLNIKYNPTLGASNAKRAPLSPPAENALFGSIFDFLKNTSRADLSGFEVPRGAY